MEIRKFDEGAAFKEAYASLNAAQKSAVDAIEGPVMVVAGPGTGKTQILTLRIANILLKTDTPPDGVLALTFTESGAKAMRERLLRYIGSTAYQVPIFTFHGFAKRLIGEYPDAYRRVVGGRPASDVEKITLIESILNQGDIKLLRPAGNPEYYVSAILHIIGELKQENIEPNDLRVIIDIQQKTLLEIEQYHTKGAHKGKERGEYTKFKKDIEKNEELLVVYRHYEAALRERRWYDFDDMILETVNALETQPDMLRDLQERYLYVLADEHQDVNGAQNRILELLASYHEMPNIFAVGDEKQAIYRFQGASLENFLFFTERFPGTKVISLTQNYRSGQTILDAAHSLVAVTEGPLAALRLPLSAEIVPESRVEARDFSHQAVEDEWVVDSVLEAIKKGVPAQEIAIIVRTNREVEDFAAALRKAGLVVAASAEGDVLHHPITMAVRTALEAVVVGKDEQALCLLMQGAYWGITPDDLLRVLSARSYHTTLGSLLGDENKLRELGVKDTKPFLHLVDTLAEARRRDVCEAPHRVLEYLLQESGLLAHVINYDSFEGARVLRRLYDEIEELVQRDNVSTLQSVLSLLQTRETHHLPLNAPYIATSREAVQILTAHRSKGLEFEVVFVPHLTNSGWGGRASRQLFKIPVAKHNSSETCDEDEQRLLYVAMTRAKKTLFFSYSEKNADNRVLEPAKWLSLIDEEFLSVESTATAEDNFSVTASLTKPLPKLTLSSELLSAVLTERGLSATALNNYLKSPWDYLYSNLLRLPETQALPMQYGTAIHNTLEFITKTHTATGYLPQDTAIKIKLEQEIGRLPLTTGEFARLLEKGMNDLFSYLGKLADSLPAQTKEEFSVRVLLPTGLASVPELPLTGKFDRLDFNSDGRLTRVVDYKTGKPKTRAVIEGKTKDSNGDYKRQLVFYALLLELYGDERYQSREGVLSFVEPDGKGVIHEETFLITDDEIASLRAEIIKVADEIATGSFLSAPYEDSEYGNLAKQWFAG